MAPSENESQRGTRSVLTDRRFLTCSTCGWVHYAMTVEEKATNDQLLNRLIQRYQLSEEEQELYESAYRQCLRCEASADEFRTASDRDLDQAEGHIVTPVFVGPEIGTN